MIKHVVMWRFPEGTEKQRDEFIAGLRGLVGKIECLRSLEVGVNVNSANKFNACLICEFDSMEDLKSYANDERHLAVARICRGIAEERVAVDFEF